MSALGSLVVKLALEHAEYTQGLDRTSQEALKFAQGAQRNFDQAANSTREFLGSVALNVAGAVTSVVGLNAAFNHTRDAINVLASLDDAAQKTGSSIQDLSRIEQVARNFGDAFGPIEQGITRLAKGIAQIDDPSSDAIRALDAIGVSARDSNGQLRTSADVYIDVARSLQKYEDGAQKTAVANALFGKSGADLLPTLNNLAQGIDHVSAVSDKATRDADAFNNAVARSKAGVNAFFTSLSVELLPVLNSIASAINQSSSQFSVLSAASGAASIVLKGLAIAAFTVVDTFRGMGREIGARAAQLSALATLDFSGAKFIGQALAEDNAKSRAEYDKFVDTVLNGENKIEQAVGTGGSKKLVEFQANIQTSTDRVTRSVEKQTKAFDVEAHKLKEYEAEAKRARDITESVATKQERYNRTLEELERLRPYLSVDAYTRSLEKAQRELRDTGAVNRSVTNQIDQQWIQAGRNIQSVLSNSIFDFFSGGMDNMVSNAKNAIGRILSEFAALKIAQSSGLGSILGVQSSGIGGTGASNVLAGGATLSSLFGKSATQSAAEKFALERWGNSGASKGGFLSRIFGSAGGAGLGQAGGVVAALGAGISVGSTVAGNKKIFGMDGMTTAMIGTVLGGPVGAVIAGAFNALFGRGPYKFRQQVALGTASNEGFDGRVTDIFRSKGGLFVSNKHKEQAAENQDELVRLFDDTIKGFSQSAKGFADNLGLSSDSISNYSKAIRIESEKGKALTEEAIQEALTGIGSDFARGLVPEIDKLKKSGESAFDALTRLNTEFTTLIDVGTALGHSLSGTRDFIKSASFDQRSAFIDASGGMDVLASNARIFSENFLSAEERLRPAQENLNEQLAKLGLSTDLTRDQFKSLVQSFGNVGGVSEQMLQSLLKLAPAFVQVRMTQEQLTQATLDAAMINRQAAISNLTSAYSSLENAVNKERQKSQEAYQKAIDASSKSIQDVTESISKLKSFGESLKSTINSIDPMRREFAKAQINTAIQTGRIDPDKLLSAVDSVKNIDSSKFTNSFDFEREQIKSAMLLGDLNDAVGVQVDKQQAQINLLNTQKDLLDAGFNNEMSRLDGILETAKMQLDTLSGINTSIIDLAAAVGMFNRAISQSGMTPSIGGGFVSGNAGISNQQINDFLKTPGLSDMDIYKAAKANGVSFEQFSTATGKNLQDLYKWSELNGVPKFESGTEYVPNTGLAIVHKGEKIIPANQNNQREVVVELRAIRDAIIKSNQEVIKRLGDSNKNMRAVMSGNASFRTSSAS